MTLGDRQNGNVDNYTRLSIGVEREGGGGGNCLCAVLQLPHGCEVEQHHLLKLMGRRGRHLTASSCQDIIYVTQQIYNMTTPLHNTQQLGSNHIAAVAA